MTIDIEEIERLAKAANPGPWELLPNGAMVGEAFHEYSFVRIGKALVDPDPADAAFIAAANPKTILELCAVVQRLIDALGGMELQWGGADTFLGANERCEELLNQLQRDGYDTHERCTCWQKRFNGQPVEHRCLYHDGGSTLSGMTEAPPRSDHRHALTK